MGQWSLFGPDVPILTKEEVVAWLRVSESALNRLIAQGRFPRPLKHSAKSAPIWAAQDLAAYLHLLPRLVADEAPESGETGHSESD